MTKPQSTSTSLAFCSYCGAAHADDTTCPVCELMEFIMTLKEPGKSEVVQ